LGGLKDVLTCEIIGLAMGKHMTQDPTVQALWKAVANKRPAPELIHYSDRKVNIALTRTAILWSGSACEPRCIAITSR